jgi:phosphate transport system protein
MIEHLLKVYEEELSRLHGLVAALGGLAGEQLDAATASAERHDPEAAASVLRREPEADRLTREIDDLAIRILALRQPVAVDLRAVIAALRIGNELERICDYAEDFAQRSIALDVAKIEPVQSLVQLSHYGTTMVKDAMRAYRRLDAAEAQEVWDRDAELDQRYTALFRELLTYMLEDPRQISANTQMLFMARTVERIGDRATNIAEIVHYLVAGVPVEEARRKADATKSMMLSAPNAPSR